MSTTSTPWPRSVPARDAHAPVRSAPPVRTAVVPSASGPATGPVTGPATGPVTGSATARTTARPEARRTHPVVLLGHTAGLVVATAALVVLTLPGDPVVVGRAGPDVLVPLAAVGALASLTGLGVAGVRRASGRAGVAGRALLALGAAVVTTAVWATAVGGLLLAGSLVGVSRWTDVGEVDGRPVVVRETTSSTGIRVTVGVRDGWRVHTASVPGAALSRPGEPTGQPTAGEGYRLDVDPGTGAATVAFDLDGPRLLTVPTGPRA